MPALQNPRWERFAIAILQGITSADRLESAQSTAYLKAYPGCSPGNSAEASASRLLRRVKPITDRIRELQQEQLARLKPKLDLSKERVGRRLALASELAEQLQNPSAIATSEMGIAKVFGHLIERHEHKVTGDYSQARTELDIGRQLLEQVGFASPDAASVALAIEANSKFVQELIAIRDQAAATLELAADAT